MSEPSESTKVTQHVTLQSLVKSDLARVRGFSNLPEPTKIPNLVRLANVIERIMDILGTVNIKIVSAYQSPRTTAATGTDPRDGHSDGRGFDFQPMDLDLHTAFDKLVEEADFPYDKIAIQWKRTGLEWICVTIPEEGEEPKGIVRRGEPRKGRAYLC